MAFSYIRADRGIQWSLGSNLQLEEGIGDLQHQHMGMVVFVTNQYTFAGSSHAV